MHGITQGVDIDEFSDQLIELAVVSEPSITELMMSLANEVGAELKGLEYRLKEKESLTRKLRAKTAAVSGPMDLRVLATDVLRYTFCVDVGQYTDAVETILQQLSGTGFTVIDLESSWDPDDTYSGVHIVVDTGAVFVETQVHTPDSYQVKAESHSLYGWLRDPSTTAEDRERLVRTMTSRWADVPVPSGIEELILECGGKLSTYVGPSDSSPDDVEPPKVIVARLLATSAHKGQTDKAGRPYVEHVSRVAHTLAEWDQPPSVVAAGWLHDIIEDTPTTAVDLARAGVADHTIKLVELLTHPKEESLEDYIARVRSHPHAVIVKRADIRDNSAPERLAALPVDLQTRLREKYRRSSALLDCGEASSQ